ncbi:hypothetical protein ZIOFF_022015 [Zingiber officinale]|uniref:Pentatricopeptide repeat-containing protein n=1 Tax=Zingiber officinale TaxID=94328 RepID=A0A8J5LJW4_ZINOF|nr:hypothetical protein ZIOFF_022015 [Zingiber officinale]
MLNWSFDLGFPSEIVKFYVETGEVEKADLILRKAFHQRKLRPLYGSFVAVMQYSKMGDIHNAENIFHMLKQMGYFVKCLEARQKIEFVEWDYTSHLDLIAKVNGLLKVEKYIEKNPEAFRGELVEWLEAGKKIELVGGTTFLFWISLQRKMNSEGEESDLLITSYVAKAYIFAGLKEKSRSSIERRSKEMASWRIATFSKFSPSMLLPWAKQTTLKECGKCGIRNLIWMSACCNRGLGLQQMDYVSGPKQYESMLQAYVNAKTPANGFAAQMKADNLFPNKALVAQLMTNDAFRELLV